MNDLTTTQTNSLFTMLEDSVGIPSLEFELPTELEASEPPEARGLARDQVKLMVSNYQTDDVAHAEFRDIVDYLSAGDVLVINTSGTMNAAINVTRQDGTPLELHLSTQLPANLWSVELRKPEKGSTLPFYDGIAGETFDLPEGGKVIIHMPHNPLQRNVAEGKVRLWLATLELPYDLPCYLETYGFPIRYSYVKAEWPNAYYQTVYATEMGSAEMPSAGRAFSASLITRLVAKGVRVMPVLLHTGVASLEDHEAPYEEYFEVPAETAVTINVARKAGKKVIAVGTTVIRALETVTQADGVVYPGQGWTDVIITPQRGIRAVNGLLTGFHEPRATHLAMLSALAGFDHLAVAYTQALAQKYLWHEFGDLHLILP